MSLPTGFLDELRTRTSLAQVVGRKVMWDTRKSNQGKGDMWAPCPFHQEKTASFHVDDRQGFYYCFGCHAKGDAISFVRETENASFIEAIEILARETGMEMPAPDPRAREVASRRSQLVDVMEAAVQYYGLLLKTGVASEAREYLAGRGLGPEAQARWDIGFAANERQGLWTHLTGKGIASDLVIDAGLAARPDDGGAPYDRFRDRIIFPIRDAQGRCIALGGRAMAADARAKYLNSPETELFDKGRSLYNQGPARAAIGKGAPLVVAEGYMDVIALSEAGFGACVAPLGTAITETQLAMLWRIDPEPIIALDGDTAGLRAAMRLIDLALPLIEAGKSLRFCLMPDGQDPDDVVRTGGAGVMQGLLDRAVPMVHLLWRRETDGKVFDSPERRAALDKSIKRSLNLIKDWSLRKYYESQIKTLKREFFQTAGPESQKNANWNGNRKNASVSPKPDTKNSLLGADSVSPEYLREAALLAVLIRNPNILPKFESDLEDLHISNDSHRSIQYALLQNMQSPPDQLFDDISTGAVADALEKLFSLNHVQLVPSVKTPGNDADSEICVLDLLDKLRSERAGKRETSDGMQDNMGASDEGMTRRISQATEARNKANRGQTGDLAEYETAENGIQLSKDDLEYARESHAKIDYDKGRKKH